MDNIVVIGIGAGALLAGLFGFFTWRRRKEEEEAIRQVEAEMAAERELAAAPEIGEMDDNLSAVEELESNESFDLDQLGEVETDDPVAEAEIHLSLGQYQEAESKLLAGLKSAPENIDARLMLLEAYAHQQKGAEFDDHYRQLLGYSDGPAADRAARLRETIAGIGPFEAPENDFSSESLEAAQLDDMGADFGSEASFGDLEEFSADQTVVAANVDAGDDEDDFGLLDDLSLDLDDSSSNLNAGTEAADEDNFSLDLDLGDDLESDLSAAQTETDTAAAEEPTFDLELDSGFESDTSSATEEDNFDLDNLMADGDLDLDSLDSLDLDSDFSVDASAEGGALEQSDSIAVDSQNATAEAVENSGLEFDLDLTPMEDGDDLDSGETAVQSTAADASEDELDSFSDDLGGDNDFDSLDLDSIDLGELDLDSGDLDFDNGNFAADASTDFELEGDLAVAEEPVAKPEPAQSGAQSSAEDAELGDLSFNLESDLDSELNLLEGSDEVTTKLELAQAYLDMGDKDGAREILGEVVEEAAGEHQQRAKDMLERIG